MKKPSSSADLPRLLLESSPGLYVSITPEEVFLSNAAFDRLPQPNKNILLAACRRALDSGTPDSFELAVSQPEGSARWYQCEVTPVRAAEGFFVSAAAVGLEITGRKQLQEDILASEERFRGIFEQAPYAAAIFSGEGRLVEYNPAVKKLWAVSDEEVEAFARTVNVLTDERIKGALGIPLIERAFGGEAARTPPVHFSPVAKGMAGRDRWIETYYYPIRDQRGRVREVVVTHNDVTDRVELERKVQAAEELRALIFNTVGDVLFYVSHEPHGRFWFSSVNLAFLRATGLKEEQVLGRFIEDVIPEPSLSTVLGHYRDAIRERSTRRWEEVSVYPTGTKHGEVTVTPLFDEDGRCLGLVGTVHDVTERKNSEENIKKAYSTLKAVVDGTTDAIFTKDLLGRYMMINSAGASYLSKRPEEVIGKTDLEILPREIAAEFVDSDRRAMSRGEMRNYEENAFLGGTRRTFLAAKGPLRDSGGRVIGLIGISRDISDLKQAQEELERSVSILKATLESTADGLLVVDSAKRITNFNQKFLDLWRMPKDFVEKRGYGEALQFVLEQLNHPEACLRRLQEIFANTKGESFDVLEFKDGRIFERYSRPQKIAGRTVGRVFSYRDITARIRAETALRESETRKTAILDSAFDAVITIDGQGRIVEASHAIEEVFGFQREFALGKDMAELIVPQRLREAHRAGITRYLETGEARVLGRRMEFSAVRADGAEIPVEVFISPLHLAREQLFTGFIRDITDRKRSESRIQRYISRARVLADASHTFAEARFDFASIVEAAARWSAEIPRDGSVVQLFSDATKRSEVVAYHHAEPDALKLIRGLFPSGRSFLDEEASTQVLKAGKAARVSVAEARIQAQLGPELKAEFERFPFHHWIIVPLRLSGTIIGLMKVIRFGPAAAYSAEDEEFLRDLADRTALAIANARLYAEARQSIRMRDDFIMMASHELRTPLTPLKGQLYLLNRFLMSEVITAGPRGRELMMMIRGADQQIHKLTRLVEDMIDVALMSAGKMLLELEWVDLSEVARKTAETFRSQLAASKRELRLFASQPVRGRFDRLRIERVLNTLLSNALKYGTEKPVEIAVSLHSGRAILSVRDFGMGIAEEDQKRLFKRFERAVSVERFGGLGLGLYITEKIVEAHGGQIQVESRLGEGATFTLTLPLNPSQK